MFARAASTGARAAPDTPDEDAGESAPPPPADDDPGDSRAIVERLREDPTLVARVAACVDSRTAARWALTFSRAAASSGGLDSTTPGRPREVAQPDAAQLRKLMIRTSVPFIGFGFFDNMIMLTVGETIDLTVGVAFGLSTLAAAGLGQMVSDASGITLQGFIQHFADRLGLPDPRLTFAQQQLSFVKYWMIFSRVVGIVFGCFLGMFPLVVFPERFPQLVDQIAETLSSQERAEFKRMCEEEHYKKGDKLVEYGEFSLNVFLVQEGSVEVIGRDIDGLPFVVCTIGPGHSFGRPELRRTSLVDVVAKDDKVIVQKISKEDFLRITEQHDESREILMSASSVEHEVYLKWSQGQDLVSGAIVAKKGTGKTRKFASLSSQDKLEVLRVLGTPEAMKFKGVTGEGKVSYFASLSEEQKRHALATFLEREEKRKQVEQPPDDAAVACA